MKNIIKPFRFCIVLLALISSSFVAACSDDNEPVEAVVKIPDTVLNSGLTFSPEGGTQKLSVQSNVPLEASSDQSWCKVEHKNTTANGTSTFEVTMEKNSETADRTATISIKANGTVAGAITVTQAPADGLQLVSENAVAVAAGGGNFTVRLKANGNYTIDIKDSWISRAPASRAAMTDHEETFIVAANYGAERPGTIVFTLGDVTQTVTVTQAEGSLPDVGMESDAKTLAAKIKIGWNLGNTLEVPLSAGGETGWGNAKTTQTLIDAVKEAGFNAVRIPCAWDGYIEDQSTYKIKDSWLARVKEVVDYCVANEMYAIVNTHWDGGWLENNPTYAKQKEVNKKLSAIWTQIANHFAAYDEHLLFAGTNEVHVEGVYTDPTTENIEVQQSFNQTFVDAVRATGGRNARRNLIVQAYNTNITWGVKYLQLPTDAAQNRLMVEVHYYDPYNFALDENASSCILYWGEPYKQYGKVDNWGQEDALDTQFKSAKTAFIDKGYPVILGEYGAIRRSSLTGDERKHHLESRAYYLKSVTAAAKKYGIVPFYWDNGHEGDNTMALFKRATGEIYDSQALNALMEGANGN